MSPMDNYYYSHTLPARPAVSDPKSQTQYLDASRPFEVTLQYADLRAGFTFLKVLYGFCWSAAYMLYVVQARKDESAGMPLLALMLNISWEFVYTFSHKQNGLKHLIHLAWFFIDALLVIETLRFGPKTWADTSPIIAEHFGQIFCLGTLLALSAHWAFANQFEQHSARFWSAYFCQNVISWGSLSMIIMQEHVGGHSMLIWWFRFVGTLAVSLRHFYRVTAWPAKYGFLAGPFAMWILWMPSIADLLYPFAYRFILHSSQNVARK